MKKFLGIFEAIFGKNQGYYCYVCGGTKKNKKNMQAILTVKSGFLQLRVEVYFQM